MKLKLPRNLQDYQDYILVTLVAVLIWLYAERNDVTSYPPDGPIEVTLRVKLPASDLVVISQSVRNVKVQFRGAAAEITRLRSVLSSGLTISPDVTGPGARQLQLASEIPSGPSLAGIAANLLIVEPSTMDIEVDRLVTRTAALSFKPRDVELVNNAWQADPPNVSITMPQGLLDSVVGDQDQVQLELEVSENLTTLAAGVQQTVKARVRRPPVPQATPVTIDPQDVQLTFTIDKKQDEVILPVVPVWDLTATEERNNYELRWLDDGGLIPDVKVSGPAELIAQMRAGTLRVVAYVQLNGDQMAKAADLPESTATIQFAVPPQLTVQSPVTTVRYAVTRRTP